MFAPKKLLAATALIFLGVSNASANLITNGDFETGSFAGWTTFVTNNGTAGHDIRIGPSDSNSASFHVGELLHDITQQGGGITQSFTSGTGEISISVDIFASTEGDGSFFSNSEGGVFQLLLDSLVIDTMSFGNMLGEETKSSNLSFFGSVSAGLHELTILITRPYTTNPWTPNQFVDNVLVQGPAPSTGGQVPEPASALLLGAGLSAMALLRRRRNTGRAS